MSAAPAAPAEEVLEYPGKVRGFEVFHFNVECWKGFFPNIFEVNSWWQVDPAYQLPPGLPPGSKARTVSASASSWKRCARCAVRWSASDGNLPKTGRRQKGVLPSWLVSWKVDGCSRSGVELQTWGYVAVPTKPTKKT